MTTRRALLLALGLATAVDLGCLAADYDPGHFVAKPLLMPLLAAWAALSGAPRLLVVALLFGWGGDTLLLFDAEPAFLAGMASFAAGHVCYLALVRTRGRADAHHSFLLTLYCAVLTTTLLSLWTDLPGDLRIPVVAYSILLTAMAYGVGSRFGKVAGTGAALFVLSDTLIATDVAEWPPLPLQDFWIMLTYVAAQFLIVTGMLKALEARPAREETFGEVRSATP
ncbi:lysoplasmalogenase [Streptomyces sp. CC219B]|uniref:lysoplasmalogenase n=1 Tax=Streptomyces sp. CC219B TaxID=3044574 RepID=UPI0024A828F0|nr:lysoplasmalogenase [Streptomyces sp. CC219B]